MQAAVDESLVQLISQLYENQIQRAKLLQKLGIPFEFQSDFGSRTDLLDSILGVTRNVSNNDIGLDLISIPELCPDKRKVVVQHFFGDLDEVTESIAISKTAGYLLQDFVKLERSFRLLLTYLNAASETKLNLSSQALKMALNQYLPINGLESVNFPEWLPFFGYQKLKSNLLQVLNFFKNQKDFKERFGINPISGLLIHGPSGVGKSHLVNTLIKHSGMNQVVISLSKVYSKYLGESEESLRAMFQKANSNSPCIVVIESLEALGVKRDAVVDTTGVYERVLSTLLNELDGIDASRRVFLIGMTTLIDDVDDALKRPGRFDSIVEMNLPTPEDREDILKGLCNEFELADCVIDELVGLSSDFTPADLVSWLREAFYLSNDRGREVPQLQDFVDVLDMMEPWKPTTWLPVPL